jgi:hypothetical protein
VTLTFRDDLVTLLLQRSGGDVEDMADAILALMDRWTGMEPANDD